MTDFRPSVRQYVASPALFLDFVVSKLEWRNLGEDVVFDVGCGNPKIKLADLLLERFPDIHRIIAIDKEDHLIRLMWRKKKNRRISYRCMDIERRSDICRFKGLVDKVLSTHCWHMVRDQAGAFGNVHFMLQPGGEAAFLFCHSSGYADWLTDLTQNVKWNKYFNGTSPIIPVTQFMKSLDDEYYIRLLEAAGFEVAYCEKDKISVPYRSDQECKEGLLKLSKCSFSVPSGMKEEFRSFIFETFLKYNERDEEGRPCHVSYYITAMAVKPFA